MKLLRGILLIFRLPSLIGNNVGALGGGIGVEDLRDFVRRRWHEVQANIYG